MSIKNKNSSIDASLIISAYAHTIKALEHMWKQNMISCSKKCLPRNMTPIKIYVTLHDFLQLLEKNVYLAGYDNVWSCQTQEISRVVSDCISIDEIGLMIVNFVILTENHAILANWLVYL